LTEDNLRKSEISNQAKPKKASKKAAKPKWAMTEK